MWNLQREEKGPSLHWLLQEPELCCGQLVPPDQWGDTLYRLLQTAGVLTLGSALEVAGPGLEDPVELALKSDSGLSESQSGRWTTGGINSLPRSASFQKPRVRGH